MSKYNMLDQNINEYFIVSSFQFTLSLKKSAHKCWLLYSRKNIHRMVAVFRLSVMGRPVYLKESKSVEH